MQWDIGLDLGETGIRLATRQRGVVLCAPSYGAIRAGEVIAIGEDAYAMLGRNPKNVSVGKPFCAGSIGSARLAALWIQQLLEPFVSASRFNRPRVLLSDSGFFNQSEKELLIATVMEAGAQAADWVSSDLLAARGAGMDMNNPKGQICVDVGAGTMSACLISFGRIVHCERVPWGAERIDRDIIHILRSTASLSVGEKTAEAVKQAIAGAYAAHEMKTHIIGLDTAGGFPKEKEVLSSMVRPAVLPLVDSLVSLILCCAEHASPELASDLLEEGVLLTGGGAMLSGLDRILCDRTRLRCRVCENPQMAVINGMAELLRSN